MTEAIALSDWPQLLALLDDALDLPAERLPAWLQTLGLPAPLRAALQRLLDERAALERADFLAALPCLPDAVEPGLRAGVLRPGGCIGPWRLVRELGQGGMSVVWLAERADGQVERQVALKLPHAGPGQDVLARRMLRERRILAALEHPHIARLYDVGLTDAGTPFLVMEYVPGIDLLAHADARRLSVGERVALFRQVLDAVQYAHGKLVLHRDLKPGNILVGASGQVKLLDFGIAKVLAATHDGIDPTQLTRELDRPLTPGYASPEQLAGQEPGTASDVYSLGVVLYHLLAGQRPHAAAGAAHRLAALLNEDAPPPSRIGFAPATAAARRSTPAALARRLRGDLDAIVGKALAPAPELRYASVEALDADLDRWHRGLPVAAQRPGAWYHLGKFVRRHRLGVVLGSAAALALVATGLLAASEWHAARLAAMRAVSARDFLLDLFAASVPDRVGGVELTAPQILELGRQRAQTKLAAQPRLQAELLAGIGQTMAETEDLHGADASLAQAAAAYRQIGDQQGEATARLDRLQVTMDDGRADLAAQQIADMAPLRSTIAADPLLALRWLRLSAGAAFNQDANGQRGDAVEAAYLQCTRQADLSRPLEAWEAMRCYQGLAGIEFHHDPVAAEAYLRQAEQVPIADIGYARADAEILLTVTRSRLLEATDRYATEMTWLPQRIAHCEAAFGRDSPRCGDLKLDRLWLLLRLGDGAQALRRADEMKPLLEQDRPLKRRFAAAHVLVRVYSAMGLTDRHLAATAALEGLLAPGAAQPLIDSLQLLAMASLARMRLRAGEVDAAAQWLRRADAVITRLPAGQLELEIGVVRATEGLVQQARGDDAGALRLMGDWCEVVRPGVQNGMFYKSLESLNCVRSLVATGQQPRAVALVRDAVARMTDCVGADAPNTRRTRELLQALQAPGPYRLRPWDGKQVFVSGMR